MYLGHSYATSFSHLHDFEPAPKNHAVPHYGIFSRLYFDQLHRGLLSSSGKYSGFKKNHGPPHYSYNPRPFELEDNDYLN